MKKITIIPINLCDINFEDVQELTKKIIKENYKKFDEYLKGDKMQEFKVGDRVKIIQGFFKGAEGEIIKIIRGVAIIKNESMTFEIGLEILVKIEDKPQAEPFELKKGMRVKLIFSEKLIDSYRMKVVTVDSVNGNSFCDTDSRFVGIEYIDLEETRKLNEVKEEPKNEKFVIWNPKGSNPRRVKL